MGCEPFDAPKAWVEVAVIRVDGMPKGQPRVKAFVRGKHAGVYTPDTADNWKNCIMLAAKPYRPSEPLDCALRISADVFFQRPAYMSKKKFPDAPIEHLAKPDRDNLDKSILDSLKNLGFMKDDSQVCGGGEVRKFYCAKTGPFCRPGAVITIERLQTSLVADKAA